MTDLHALETERLKLIPFRREVIEALGSGEAAERAIGAAIPNGWPDDELAGLLEIYAPWIADDPSRVGYGPWIVVARELNTVVGGAGFLGTPNEDGSIELGFGVHPDYRNQGYASEAAEALVAWGLGQPSVERVVAKCDPDNLASIRALEKAGLTRCGDAEGMLLWQADGS